MLNNCWVKHCISWTLQDNLIAWHFGVRDESRMKSKLILACILLRVSQDLRAPSNSSPLSKWDCPSPAQRDMHPPLYTESPGQLGMSEDLHFPAHLEPRRKSSARITLLVSLTTLRSLLTLPWLAGEFGRSNKPCCGQQPSQSPARSSYPPKRAVPTPLVHRRCGTALGDAQSPSSAVTRCESNSAGPSAGSLDHILSHLRQWQSWPFDRHLSDSWLNWFWTWEGKRGMQSHVLPSSPPQLSTGYKVLEVYRSQKSQAQAEDLGLSCQGIYSQDPTGGALGRLSAPQRLYFTPNIHLHSCQGPRVQAPSKGSDLCENPTMARTQHGKNPPFWVHSSPFSAFILWAHNSNHSWPPPPPCLWHSGVAN